MVPASAAATPAASSSEPSACNFAALTAFSGDDPAAARSILESFVDETRLNLEHLRQAVAHKDMRKLSDVSHKMIPLFTLLGATDIVSLLRKLEAAREETFSDTWKQQADEAGRMVEEAARQAENL